MKFNKNNKKNKKKNNKKSNQNYIKNISLISTIFFIIIFAITIIRTIYFFGITPNSETYNNYLKILNSKNSFINYNQYTLNNKIYFNDLFYIFSNNLLKKFPNINISYVAITLALLSYIFFMLIINKLYLTINKNSIKKNKTKTNKKEILIYSGILFLISPELIFLTISLNPLLLTLFLLLTLIYLLISHETTTKKYLSIILITLNTILISLTNARNYAIIILIIITFYLFYRKKIKHKKIYNYLFFISILSFLISNYNILINHQNLIFGNYNIIKNSYFIELGSYQGIKVIDLILTIIGISLMWSQKNKYYITSLLIIIIIYLSTFNQNINSLIFPVYAILGGIAINFLLKREWNVNHLKPIIITLILIFEIVFTTSYILKIGFDEPNIEQFYTYKWLSQKNNGTIFSEISNSYFIELLSKKKIVIEPKIFKKDYKTYKDYKKIIHSRDINIIEKQFNLWNIKYIIIDDKIKNILDNKEDGIIFVLKNSKDFKQIYQYRDTEIYEYKRNNQTNINTP